MSGLPTFKIGPNDAGSMLYSPLLPYLPSPTAGSKVPGNHVIWVM